MSYNNPYSQAPQAEAGYGYSQPYDQQVSAAPDAMSLVPISAPTGLHQSAVKLLAPPTTETSRRDGIDGQWMIADS